MEKIEKGFHPYLSLDLRLVHNNSRHLESSFGTGCGIVEVFIVNLGDGSLFVIKKTYSGSGNVSCERTKQINLAGYIFSRCYSCVLCDHVGSGVCFPR